MKSKNVIVILALVECFLLILLVMRGKTIPQPLYVAAVVLGPFIALGLGIAFLFGGGCAKSKDARVALSVIGVVVITLSLVFIGGCLMVARGLHSLM
jgi:hypothetical protein